MLDVFMILVPLVIIGMIVSIGITLRAANRNDGRVERRRDRYQDDNSNVVNTGRGVLIVIGITVAIALAVMAIILGTCISTTQL
jgi:hypothetical protein